MFDIVDGEVIINPDELAIPVFKKIYERDKSISKTKAFNIISYIVFMWKWDSPYASFINEESRDKIIKKDIFGDENYEIDDLTKEAITRYKEFQHTFSLQFLEQNMVGAKKLMDFYQRVNWDEVDKTGKPIYSSRDLAANLEKAGGILKSLESLKQQVKREGLEVSKTRGQNDINPYEDMHSLKEFQKNTKND